ncbi:hypothetical protein PGT21_026618 [Puccinia graminis f. sp. tritici]|uniref:Uncharacterized protein n=2 Tax=Puccinia graminis f. sp. tritici TaxID=56615 RepID=E3KGV7_PUCGT|nr:uncharacterized protein PGTG_08718 [Puccinia graminis f. sp. tritici CRL 75-36-700-3]EFP83532.2 hypothetical protein PGTG_08718 [Puccinia graminis f. sp. tritici CRL 75-36-700-3]KAA1078006.1 hypothetical protein PGT21_026618 [Puccinia graminis f. sp. tritici]KAA1103684.1 hypothetical protein PGTUg99_002887 [Puccinia graminis f. sp. tritici]
MSGTRISSRPTHNSVDELKNGSRRRAENFDPETSLAECSHRVQDTKHGSCAENELNAHYDSEDKRRRSSDTQSIPTPPGTIIDSEESFQCRGLDYEPDLWRSHSSLQQPIAQASGSGFSHRGSSYSSSIPASPGTVESDSDESFQCRGLQYEPGEYTPDLGSHASISPASGSGLRHRGTGHSRSISTSPEAVAVDSDESFQCRGLSYQSEPEHYRPDPRSQDSISRASASRLSHRGTGYSDSQSISSGAVDSDSDESFQCRGLSFQSEPEQHRPDPSPQGFNTWTSTGGNTKKNPRKDRNFLGLRLDLASISNFKLKETDSNHRQDDTETKAPNAKFEVESLTLPVAASPLSPAYPAKTSLSNSGVPILGSSKLRTLKLERENRQKSRLHGIKTALKRILRVPKGKNGCGKLDG